MKYHCTLPPPLINPKNKIKENLRNMNGQVCRTYVILHNRNKKKFLILKISEHFIVNMTTFLAKEDLKLIICKLLSTNK